MKSLLYQIFFLLLVVFFSNSVFSQENLASNVSKSVSDGEKLLITYDLVPGDNSKSFSVILLLTYQGQQIEASSAYGDIGSNIGPGKEKAIVWYFKDDFDGDINNVEVDILAYKENEPQAIFKIASIGNKGYAPSEVTFLNNSSYANEYQWNFGDLSSGSRNVSFEKNPAHVFEKGGIYSIALTARNTQLNLENTYYQSIEIKTYDPTVANFEIEGNNQLPPAKVNFKNTSVNADTYQWDFGDPSGGRKNITDKDEPRYKYKNPGMYKVTLIVKNNLSGLSDTIVKEVVVEQEKVAEAGFVFTKSSETAPSTVAFKNTSVNAAKYEWDFDDPSSGNKNTSSETNLAHTFASPGSYNVTLSAWARGEKKPSTFSDVVTIMELPKPPEASFSIENNNVLGPATIIFKNTSQNAEEYSWDFGDPDSEDENTSNIEKPTHTYQKAGRYKVTLTASHSKFNNKSTASEYVVIVAPSQPPVANFTIEAGDLTSPAEVSFSNASVNADSFSWDFGDSNSSANVSTENSPTHTFTKAGKYKVVIVVTNSSSGLSNTYSEFVTIAPPLAEPVANFEITFSGEYVPLEIAFKNSSENADSWEWNFGDFDSNNNESTKEKPVHKYVVPGAYKITLTALNSETGKKDELSKKITLKSNFSTFVKTAELGKKGRSMLAVAPVGSNEIFGLSKNDKNKSSLLKIDLQGEVIDENELDFLATDIIYDNGELIAAGVESSDKLVLQKIESNLKTGSKVDFQQRKNFMTDYSPPVLSMSITDEIGIVANTVDDKYPIDILFQKAEKSGIIIPLVDRTFKYVGTKLVTDLVPTSDGGFALTGYWREDQKSPLLILFGKIDRKGHGEMHLISSEMNIIGCDIEESYQDGFAVLRAKEGIDNSDIYEMSFILIDSDGGPTDCATMLPCSINKDDILNYRPCMIKAKNGYVIACHGFNGIDYDISLYWIDKTGNVLMKYEVIKLPGNQFVMDFVQANDGGFLISGTNENNALLIKTDPYGKLNAPLLP